MHVEREVGFFGANLSLSVVQLNDRKARDKRYVLLFGVCVSVFCVLFHHSPKALSTDQDGISASPGIFSHREFIFIQKLIFEHDLKAIKITWLCNDGHSASASAAEQLLRHRWLQERGSEW